MTRHGAEFDRPTASDGGATIVRWQIVGFLILFAFLNHFNRTCVSVAQKPLQDEFGFSNEQIGLIASSFILAYVIAMVPGGLFSDRFGPRSAMAIVGIGTGVFVALTGLAGMGFVSAAGVLYSFLAIRFLAGTFTGPLFPAAGRAVANWIPFASRAWANGLVIGATTAGVSLAHVLFGQLMDAVGWRMAFGIMGAITSGLGLIWILYATNQPHQHPLVNDSERKLILGSSETAAAAATATLPTIAPPFEWIRAFRQNRSLVLLTVTYATIGYFEYMLFYWMEHYFKDVLKFSTDDSRFYATLAPLPMIVTMPLGGLISDRLVQRFGLRIGRSSVAIVGMLSSAVLLHVAGAATGTWAVGWFMAAHGAIGLCEAPSWVAALELGGRRCATSAAIVNTGGNFGGMISPYTTPLLGTRFGWHWGLGVASMVCLVGVVLWLFIDPSRPADT